MVRMVASPKLSKYFYEYEQRNRRLPASDLSTAPTPPRRTARARGFSAGTGSRNRLSGGQEQTIISLLQTMHNAAAVRREFIKAGHGTVSTPTVCKLAKREGIPLGKLSL
jgi:hypothetical protein